MSLAGSYRIKSLVKVQKIIKDPNDRIGTQPCLLIGNVMACSSYLVECVNLIQLQLAFYKSILSVLETITKLTFTPINKFLFTSSL